MKLNTVKRLALSGLLALSVTGGTLAPVMAGHASADVLICEGLGKRQICHRFPE